MSGKNSKRFSHNKHILTLLGQKITNRILRTLNENISLAQEI